MSWSDRHNANVVCVPIHELQNSISADQELAPPTMYVATIPAVGKLVSLRTMHAPLKHIESILLAKMESPHSS